MRLNLPILETLENAQTILIAGAGGGFDVFAGLPIYFALRELGKTVHLANYSFCHFDLIEMISEPIELLPGRLLGARPEIKTDYGYYPEGYLSQWFQQVRGEDVTVWMFNNSGVLPLQKGYTKLLEHLGQIDALILVDGGVDSLMRGDEHGAGTLVEDSISLAATKDLPIPIKILACIGFGTEVEEGVCHRLALENIANLIKLGGFLGSCAVIPQMEAFQLFEAACRYVWEKPDHAKSHISTRIIPAAHGEFGYYAMYPDASLSANSTPAFHTPLMSQYWFFNAQVVVEQNLVIESILETVTKQEAFQRFWYAFQNRARRECRELRL